MTNSDYRGVFFHRLRLIKLILIKIIFNNINKISCRLKNVKIGTNCTFYGMTSFARKPMSRIIVGKNCVFSSLQISNQIGINRKCSISTILPDSSIDIGNNCGFSGTVIGSFTTINIGNNVRCGANTLITDGDWHFDDPRISESKPIIINDNVWLGANVVVLKGVTIGTNSVIGINSVVTKDIPENVIAAGNPCKVLKSI